MKTQEIAIRSIQHYMYCPHRWGLMEIDRAWAENAFVTFIGNSDFSENRKQTHVHRTYVR